MEKFTLTNTVLYAKGWYLQTDDLIEDLKKILELDGYTAFIKNDVYNIILHRVEDFAVNNKHWTKMSAILDGIHPYNCWKHNYYIGENNIWADAKTKIQKYDQQTAFIYYALSNMRDLSKEEWNVKMPRVTKYPKDKNITIKDLYDMFCVNLKP